MGRVGQLFQPQQHRCHGAQAADALAQEGGPGHAVHAHAPRGHKEDIHPNVAQGGNHQEQEGRAGISHGGEDARGNIVEEQEQQAAGINVEIGFRVGHELGGRVDGGEQRRRECKAQRHQDQAQHAAGNKGGVHRRAQVAIFLGAEQQGQHHVAPYVAPKGKGQINQRNLISVAHGGQGCVPQELARHKAVRQVVQLLEYNTPQQRQRKAYQNLTWLPHG